MQKIIKQCDRCGRIIEQKEYTGPESLTNGLSPSNYLSFLEGEGTCHKQHNYELCDDCVLEFLDWVKIVKAPTVEEEPAAAPTEAPEKGPVKLKPKTRTYHRWTEEEDNMILYNSAGLSSSQLAYKFGVTIDALRARKCALLNGKV